MKNNDERNVFLTFDDGPREPYTSDILDILDRFGAKATFFVCGANAKRFPETLRRIPQEGHAVGNHTYTHSLLKSLSGLWGDEIEQTSELINSFCGFAPKLFRPPWGRTTPQLRKKVSFLNMSMALWNVDSLDWMPVSPRRVSSRISKIIKSGSVVLLHDRPRTVAALPAILEALRKKNLNAIPLDEG